MEVGALYAAFKQINAVRNKKRDTRGRIFIAKAVIILAMAKKSPDADHLTNLVYDARAVDAETLTRELEEAQRSPERIAIPGYALDCHTTRGRKLGKTKWDFFLQEHDALMPREPGLFDDDLERLRRTIDELGGGKPGKGTSIKRLRG